MSTHTDGYTISEMENATIRRDKSARRSIIRFVWGGQRAGHVRLLDKGERESAT